MSRSNRAVILALTLAVGVLAGVACAQDDSESNIWRGMAFEWTAPTTGSPVVRYEVQIWKNRATSNDITNLEVMTNRVVFDAHGADLYEVRVRGVDAANRPGPWSGWSIAENWELEDPSFN